MTATTYFRANKAWWGGALFIPPVAAAIAGNVMVGVVLLAVLVLPVFVIFDTDRGWWSDEVKALLLDSDRSRRELRLLTLSAGAGLALGLVTAYLLG